MGVTCITIQHKNALYPNDLNEIQNYEDHHHLPKVSNRPMRKSTESLNYRDDLTKESRRAPSGPKLSREEILPGSTSDLPNPLYNHTEQRMAPRSQINNELRPIQNPNHQTTPDRQTDIPFSTILDKHTAIYRQYALPDTNNPRKHSQESRKPSQISNDSHDFHQNRRKESNTKQHGFDSRSVDSNSNYYTTKDDKRITQYDSPIIKAPSEFSDVEHSPLSPMSMSFSNMMTMPVNNIHLTERQLPIEYVPLKKISQGSMQSKPTKKKTPPKVPMKPIMQKPPPVKYIPIDLDNPMVNPDFLPVNNRKNSPAKKITPPKRPPSPIEYIPVPVNPRTGIPQVMNRPQRGMRHPHPGSNRPRSRTPAEGPVFVTPPHESQRYAMHPSAPRLSYSSRDGWRSEAPSPFASIDPRKLRTQRVSPMLFVPTFPLYKQM